MKYFHTTLRRGALTAVIVYCSYVTYGQKAVVDTVTYYSTSEIDAFLATSNTSARLIAKLLGHSADGENYLVGVRTAPGDVEIHEQFDDVAIIRSGHGVLRTGTRVTGQKESGQIGSREWIGGVIEDGAERNLSPGDFVVVPAGLAHQYNPKPGESLTYWLIKVKRPPTAGR